VETHPEVVVLEEGKARHDTDIDELARAAKVVLKVGAGRLLRDASDVETAARHWERARAELPQLGQFHSCPVCYRSTPGLTVAV
jgi:hypothetical protein